MNENSQTESPSVSSADWGAFILDYPPGSKATVNGVDANPASKTASIFVPELLLKCDAPTCGGERSSFGKGAVLGITPTRLFQASAVPGDTIEVRDVNAPVWYEMLLQYYCRQCCAPLKLYSFRLNTRTCDRGEATVIKVGEWPAFAPRTPARLITLIGPDRDYFLKGRRAEIEGLGIGAFSYYRRVIENQKDRLFDEIIRVAQRRGAAADIIDRLNNAKAETRFSKAVESAKDAIPEVLHIKGHNPLTLLHSALSEGLHTKSDEECLGIATSIRIVMGQLAEQMAQVLRDEREIDIAISRLLNPSI